MIVVGIGGMAWLRSEKTSKIEASRALDAPRQPDAAIQLFFDGPLKAIFDSLQIVLTGLATNRLEHKDVVAQLLSAAKHDILTGLRTVQAGVADEIKEQNSHLHAKLDSLEGELSQMRDMLVRIESNMMRRRA